MDLTKLPAKVESNTAKLSQLSDEVTRIARTLAHLAMQPEVTATSEREPANDGVKADISIEIVRNVIRANRLRDKFFDQGLFADPAWEMLLDLFQAELAQLRVSVSSLCVAAAVPATTALRWITTMTEADLFRRRADPHDARRVFVELSPMASEAMGCYFKALEEPSVNLYPIR